MNNYILYLSGARNQQFYIKPQVSGLYLNNLDLNSNKQILAPNLVYNTGNQNIAGNKTFINNINVSGTGVFNAVDLNNIDDLSISGVNVSIIDGAISLTNRPTVNGTGVVLSGELTTSGNLLQGQINTLTTNLFTTGSNLNNKINSLSGSAVLTFGNQSIDGAKTFNSGIIFNASNGGSPTNFYNARAINFQALGSTNSAAIYGSYNGYPKIAIALSQAIIPNVSSPLQDLIEIKGGQTVSSSLMASNIPITISGNSVLTGVNLSSYATITNLALTGSTLATANANYSGWAANTYATISNLFTTGSTLATANSNYSGWVANTYATANNLFSTGSNLDNKINSLSGYVNSQDIIFSGQTFNTGSRLDNKINNLSGFVNNNVVSPLFQQSICF